MEVHSDAVEAYRNQVHTKVYIEVVEVYEEYRYIDMELYCADKEVYSGVMGVYNQVKEV